MVAGAARGAGVCAVSAAAAQTASLLPTQASVTCLPRNNRLA